MSSQQVTPAFVQPNIHELTLVRLEQAIEVEPENIEHYLGLGIVYILLGQEEAAQTTWICGMAQLEETDIPKWTSHLVHLLDIQAQEQMEQGQPQVSWLLRQHLRELAPDQVNNLLRLLQLELQLNTYTPALLAEWQLATLLQDSIDEDIDNLSWLQVISQLLEFPSEEVLALVDSGLAIPHFDAKLSPILYEAAYDFAARRSTDFEFAISLLERVTQIEPSHRAAWRILSGCYRRLERFEESIKAAQKNFQLSATLEERYVASCVLESTYLKAGLWHQIDPIFAENHELLESLLVEKSTSLDLTTITCLLSDPAHFLYLKDDLVTNRRIQNQAAQIFYQNIQKNVDIKSPSAYTNSRASKKPIKIGFIGHSLYAHSVGWLSRWLFKHLDKNAFKTSIYLVMTEPTDPFVQQWLAPHVQRIQGCTEDLGETIEKIMVDEVDILIDLEGQTLNHASCVLSLKPAPIQATWLGWDASGLPSVDYFIADPYVLPEEAQKHYQEKIWRLPQTYIAVEGFESEVPSLRRDDLKIPTDAMVYLTCQDSCKRNPRNIRLQIQILKQVPNSYLLIKGQSHTKILQDLFCEIAESEGVSPEQLRFLPHAPSELAHRANLQIADVVLDTFPYNGATTTMETLWMGIPVVTLAGSQFTARYGYTLLTNAGLIEGIAWSEQEYLDWGIRYGTDASLRLQVAYKLRQSRHHAPLWDAKKFTREMEKVFQQMWQIYIESAAP